MHICPSSMSSPLSHAFPHNILLTTTAIILLLQLATVQQSDELDGAPVTPLMHAPFPIAMYSIRLAPTKLLTAAWRLLLLLLKALCWQHLLL